MAAATDQNYRPQKTLDIVFAVSCILMLVGIIWMYAQDQYRDWKVEQRQFRDVEEAILQRAVVRAAPDPAKLDTIKQAEKDVVEARKRVDTERDKSQPQVEEWLPQKVKAEGRFQEIKADLDSIVSFYDIAVDERNAETAGSTRWKELNQKADEHRREIDVLKNKLAAAQEEVDKTTAGLNKGLANLKAAEADLGKKEDNLKALVGEFDRFHRLAEQKRWGAGDWFRSLPVIDGFASPIKIEQTTLEHLPINYGGFKYVTRYDRCKTCHKGIDDPKFDPAAIEELTKAPSPELQLQLENAKKSLQARRDINKDESGLDPNDIRLSQLNLTKAQIREFSAHPRLDLFVGPDSPHKAETFGCTICHQGQGSATDFYNASHTPNTTAQMTLWKEQPNKDNQFGGHSWKSNHYWDFPMLPNRFIESTCVKCHHQITDLIRDGSRNEAPKLLRGYNLVRENGCFGCHEIAGKKDGRPIGPDMRLEPNPALDQYTPAEKVKILGDAQNPPGAMRKVGPSLRRISEKTNADWVRLWIKSPRTFRPTTKMPHFYGLSNNHPDVLPGDQKDFPDAEVHSITHYLMRESRQYLGGTDQFRLIKQRRLAELEEKQKKGESSDLENREIDELKRALELFAKPTPLVKKVKEGGKEVEEWHIVDGHGEVFAKLPEAPKDDKGKQEHLKNGRKLFSEKGCLSCHYNTHLNTDGDGLPAIKSDAHFGPGLSRIAGKLGTGTPDSARAWLVQWIINPNEYHPRTFMPITHLKLEEANDVAFWLLSQNPNWPSDASKQLDTPGLRAPSTDTLKRLAQVYLERGYSPGHIRRILKDGFAKEDLESMRADQDERELAGPFDKPEILNDKLKNYIGKKAIGQFGCFACHDIPGFEYAKPIGTPLNDWGKKDAERLAFEDVGAYIKDHHYMTPGPVGKDGAPFGVKDGKKPYDKYFFDLLEHHQREGFLYQKLQEPRSFDFDRMRVWDERLRMPQFKFSRLERKDGESDTEFEARSLAEESEAREAVMTFILGLVAEPIPAKFVHNPGPERQAEVKGRQVLDKFNCNGCHLVRSGVYDFKLTPVVDFDKGAPPLANRLLGASYSLAGTTLASDFKFADHNAWTGSNPLNVPRLAVKGVHAKKVNAEEIRDLLADAYKESLPAALKDRGEGLALPTDVKELIQVRLTEAIRFGVRHNGKEHLFDIPASSNVLLPPRDLTYPPGALDAPGHGPYGGAFADLLVRYLTKLDPQKFPLDPGSEDSAKARPFVPPALLREGEKTQPDWLFRFLRDPHMIRPMAVLRMPKFNLSDDDASALVDYFAAADRLSNPAFGVQYPYFNIKERDESFLLHKNSDYVNRLRNTDKGKWYDERIKELTPVWEKLAAEQARVLEDRLKAARETADKAKAAEDKENDAGKKKPLTDARVAAEKARDAIDKELQSTKDAAAKKDFQALRQQWEQKEAYPVDGFRLVAGDGTSVCLACHKVGGIEPKEWQGPDLAVSWQRLRPEWTERWIANPNRFTTYQSWMPQNFPRDMKPEDQQKLARQFLGNPLQQVTGSRDFLMLYPKIHNLPTVRAWPPPVYEATPGGK